MRSCISEVKYLKETKNSSYAVYFFGIAFFVYGLIFPLYRLSDLLIATGVSVLATVAAARVLPKEEVVKKVENSALQEAMKEADAYIEAVRKKTKEISDKEITAKLEKIESLTTEIFNVALVQDEEVKDVRRMLNYYLPTVIKLLDKYTELSEVTYSGENISTSLEKINEMLGNVVTAFEKHLDGMYSQDAMDIDSEIMVLEQILTSEGLLEKKDETIKLTLE